MFENMAPERLASARINLLVLSLVLAALPTLALLDWRPRRARGRAAACALAAWCLWMAAQAAILEPLAGAPAWLTLLAAAGPGSLCAFWARRAWPEDPMRERLTALDEEGPQRAQAQGQAQPQARGPGPARPPERPLDEAARGADPARTP